MTQRLHRLVPDDLDAAQRAVYDSIAGGDRAKGVQHFPLTASDKSLNGPFGIMLHAPAVGASLQELGATIRYRTSLSARIREIAILMVACHTQSDFEWWAHERVGRAAGLTEPELQALSASAFWSDDAVEDVAAQFCSAVLSGGPIIDSFYETAVDVLGSPAMIELTALVGYYRTLADLMRVFDVGIPAGS